MTERNAVWATCRPCKHTWIIAHLPMEMATVARLMKSAACPKCGGKKEMFVASEADIVAALAPPAEVR